jgi:uncharacterized membrane protein (UPF0127 family)
MPHLLRTLLISLLLAAPAMAQGVATFTYQRGQLTLLRASPPPVAAMPWQETQTPQAGVADITFAVDIRPAANLYLQEGWMNLGGIASHTGLLYIFDTPQPAQIGHIAYYQPVDIVWIDAQGAITTIAPNIILSEQQKTLVGNKPSKAILLLAGGSTAAQQIQPGDRVTGSEFFTAAPVVISSPPTAAE